MLCYSNMKKSCSHDLETRLMKLTDKMEKALPQMTAREVCWSSESDLWSSHLETTISAPSSSEQGNCLGVKNAGALNCHRLNHKPVREQLIHLQFFFCISVWHVVEPALVTDNTKLPLEKMLHCLVFKDEPCRHGTKEVSYRQAFNRAHDLILRTCAEMKSVRRLGYAFGIVLRAAWKTVSTLTAWQ